VCGRAENYNPVALLVCTDFAAGHDPQETNRHGGLVVFVVISYDNIDSSGARAPTYTYYVSGSVYSLCLCVYPYFFVCVC